MVSDPVPDDLFDPPAESSGPLPYAGFREAPVFAKHTVSNEPRPPAPEVVVRRAEPRPSKVFDTYWRFAAERQAIYFRRLRGEAVTVAECAQCTAEGVRLEHVDGAGRCPHRVAVLALTADPILAEHRFTNAYRASDRVSQYLIREVIYQGDPAPREVIWRTLLFKVFNKVETWELLRFCPPRWADAAAPVVAEALAEAKAAGKTLYSAAYMMPSPGNAPEKHIAHIRLLDGLVGEWERLAGAKSLRALYELLLAVPSFGPFLAFQYAIDLNYTPLFNFDEDECIVPGPGARDGLRKCFTDFGDYSEPDVIRWTCERAELEFGRLGLQFQSLFGRALHLIDAQNLFCEISKYARVAHPEVAGVSGRVKIKQKYRPDPKPLPAPFFPPKWGINDRVSR